MDITSQDWDSTLAPAILSYCDPFPEMNSPTLNHHPPPPPALWPGFTIVLMLLAPPPMTPHNFVSFLHGSGVLAVLYSIKVMVPLPLLRNPGVKCKSGSRLSLPCPEDILSFLSCSSFQSSCFTLVGPLNCAHNC